MGDEWVSSPVRRAINDAKGKPFARVIATEVETNAIVVDRPGVTRPAPYAYITLYAYGEEKSTTQCLLATEVKELVKVLCESFNLNVRTEETVTRTSTIIEGQEGVPQ